MQLMGLFRKPTQRITISCDAEDVLHALASEISARKLSNTKVSSVRRIDDQWHCVITCKDAEAIYYQELLPLLRDVVAARSFQVVLEFNDQNELVKKCPTELLVSFGLTSLYAFGDKADHEFTQTLHRNIVQGTDIQPASVSYYIVSDDVVTMSIPCLDIKKMDKYIQDEFKAHGIMEFTINTANRERV